MSMGEQWGKLSNFCHPVFLNLIYIYLAGFLITLSPNRPFASNTFFRPKIISKVAITKTKSATAFFSSPPFLLLALSFGSFPFPSLLWFWSFSGLKKRAFWRFFTQMTANFVRLVVKKSARYIYIYTCLHSHVIYSKIFQSGEYREVMVKNSLLNAGM